MAGQFGKSAFMQRAVFQYLLEFYFVYVSVNIARAVFRSWFAEI